MQRQGIFCLILALLATFADAALKTAVSEARLFMRSHVGKAPRGDELAELKGANPEAYAIVKALLTKRSLGLLDPKHPTPSFAGGGKPAEQNAEAEQGPEVFQKFASPEELRSASAPHQQSLAAQRVAAAVPYAEVQGSSHHDWMNWKPQSSAMDDETMVQNVLGAVAELKGKKAGLLSKSRSGNDNALSADEQSFGADSQDEATPTRSVAPAAPALEVSAPVVPVAAPAQPLERPAHENTYLRSIDLGAPTLAQPQAHAAPAKHVNSYLNGLDLSGDMPEVVATDDSSKKPASKSSNNYLASFSWDDAAKPQQQQEQPQATAHVEAPVQSNGKDSTLLSWLGVVRKAPQPQAAVAPAKPANPYLMDLS